MMMVVLVVAAPRWERRDRDQRHLFRFGNVVLLRHFGDRVWFVLWHCRVWSICLLCSLGYSPRDLSPSRLISSGGFGAAKSSSSDCDADPIISEASSSSRAACWGSLTPVCVPAVLGPAVVARACAGHYFAHFVLDWQVARS